MLLEEIIQRIQSLYSKGLQSKDTRLTPRHIYSAINTARSILLKQQYNKRQKVSQWSYQTLPCVELIKAPVYECPCVPSNGCVILRSKHKIPKPVLGIDKHLIQSLTSLDGSRRFDENDFRNIKYSGGNKYTGKLPDYYFRNQYLYVTEFKQLKAVTLTALFHDPIEVENFPSLCPCTDCDCRDIMKIEYPFDGDLIKPLIQLSQDELIIIMKQMNEDNYNNASDDTGTQGIIHQPQQEQ
jgi:hypothetical protein